MPRLLLPGHLYLSFGLCPAFTGREVLMSLKLGVYLHPRTFTSFSSPVERLALHLFLFKECYPLDPRLACLFFKDSSLAFLTSSLSLPSLQISLSLAAFKSPLLPTGSVSLPVCTIFLSQRLSPCLEWNRSLTNNG